jgi:hypothetical protein
MAAKKKKCLLLNAREVAMQVNEQASIADSLEAYNTQLYVRIPGIGMREVKQVRLDEDCFVVLDLDWMKIDMGKVVREP